MIDSKKFEYIKNKYGHYASWAIWSEEWEKNLVTTATEHVKKQVKAKHFQIYDLHVLQHWPVKRVAETLNVSVARIYMTKHRIGRLMRRAIQAIDKQEM